MFRTNIPIQTINSESCFVFIFALRQI